MTEHTKKALEAKCFCGSVHFHLVVPESKLPLAVHLCHCSLCRYRSGAPCVFHADIDNTGAVFEFVAPSAETAMKAYNSPGAVSSWMFCSTCGCHIGSKAHSSGDWTISSSIFADNGPANFQIKKHIFSKSLKDGGIACMLPRVGGRDMIDWNPPDNDPRSKIVEAEPEFDDEGNQLLRAKCMCEGVSFRIRRPNEADRKDEFFRSFLSPLDRKKWFASLDVCDDCRILNGTHVIGWAFMPLSAIDTPIKRDLLVGTSQTYVSSEGVLRSFCGTCSATIFYSCDDRCFSEDRQVVDVASGILRAPEGSMAEEWLTWRTRLSSAPSGKKYDAEFVEALEDGIKKWTLDRYGQELHVSIG